MIRNSVLVAALIVLTFLPAASQAAPPVRVLLVCGGCCHDYDQQRNLIADGLRDRANCTVTVVHQGGSASDAKISLYENDNWSDGFDVVIHDECFAAVKDADWVERILRPHRQGLPAVVVHCAMHCYRTGGDEWFQFCGVTSRRHGQNYAHEVLNRDAAHPIMARFPVGWSNPAGELYWIEKLWPHCHPLATAKNQENGRDEVCVWTNQYGQGRVFGTTLGHHNEIVAAPEFLDLLTRGTLWAADRLNEAALKTPQPRQVPVNLALNKPTSASTEQGENRTARAVDGDPRTRWCASSAKVNEWWQVDLGQPTTLRTARIEWEASTAQYRYRVETSVDGTAWTSVVDGSKNERPGRTEDALTGVVARQVRITFLGSTGGWGSIREVQLLGDESTTVTPVATNNEVEQALLSEVHVPEGFKATVFAAPPAGQYPVFVSAAPNGDLYVAQDRNGSLGRKEHYGSVLRLRDLDGDGRADEARRFIADVDSPRGLVWDRDRLYLLHPPHLTAYIDRDGDGVADDSYPIVKNIAFDLKTRPADHTSNGVTLGIDGWLYLAIGDFGFLEAEGADGRKLQLRGGGVVRVRPDGTGLELYSRGTRNILIAAFDPLLNGFSRDNTNDGGGWDIRLHHYSGGGDQHGYPSLFKNFGDEIIQPLADYGGGSGCGGKYLDEPGFPAGYGTALYTADWGRGHIYRHPLSPRGATFTAEQHDCFGLVRATDLDVDASSRLYLSSWRGGGFAYSNESVGFIARVVPQGYRAPPLPDFSQADEAMLVELLRDPSHRRRMEAQRRLACCGPSPTAAGRLVALVKDREASLATRVAAIFALKQGLGGKSTDLLIPLMAEEPIREWVIRALGDRLDEVAGVPLEPIVRTLADPNPRVRVAAAIAIGRLKNSAGGAPLVPVTADADPIVAHTAVNALVSLGADDACLAVVRDAEAVPAVRAGALRALQFMHRPEVVDHLVAEYERETNAARRQGLISVLCRLYHREGTWRGESWGTRPDTSGPYYQPETWEASPRIAATLRTAVKREAGTDAAHLFYELNRNKIELDGSLEALLAAARRDPSVVPAAIGQLSRAERVPEEAVPLLVEAASRESSDLTGQMQTIQALAKAAAPEAWRAALTAMAKLQATSRNKSEYDRARDALLNSAKLELQLPWLTDLAAGGDSAIAVWADAALLQLSTRGSAEARSLATAALDTGWQQSPRRAQIIAAVGLAKHGPSKTRVLSAQHDPDAKVVAAANKTIKDLRWDQPSLKPEGPKIATLAPEAAVELVLKTKGNVAAGEELFARLNCAKCHTVKPDETLRGPFLGNIAATYRRRELAESILLPSKSIAQGFATNQFVLDDGRTLTGFVTLEAADRVVIRDLEGRETTIPTKSIEERAKQPISMMPEQLAKDLAINELASLVDYLESLVKK